MNIKNNKSKITLITAFSLFFFIFVMYFGLSVNSSYAQAKDNCDDTLAVQQTDDSVANQTINKDCITVISKFKNPIGIDDLNTFISKLMQIVIKIGVPVAVFFMVYSGFLFVSSRGNEEQVTKAKKTFLYTVIGVALLLGAWALATAIQGTVNKLAFDIINNINLFI